jgi:hypothetical protein
MERGYLYPAAHVNFSRSIPDISTLGKSTSTRRAASMVCSEPDVSGTAGKRGVESIGTHPGRPGMNGAVRTTGLQMAAR